MIPYLEALSLVREAAIRLGVEEVHLDDASGRVVGAPITSPMAQPPFPNAAMDGFALATGASPRPAGSRWRIVGSVAAGDPPEDPAAATSAGRLPLAWEIMTGAPVPEGFDTVIPVEEVEVEELREGRPLRIRITTEATPGRNIRPAGKDFQRGDRVLEPGRRIGPIERMALAALGIARVPVMERPRAVVLCTGPELVDDPAAELPPGRIRNSNGPFLQSALEAEGVEIVRRRTLGDDPDPFVAEVVRAREEGVHLVVSTGAVSMGRHDFVPAGLARVGARTLFHRVAVRPGKPVLAATLPGGGLYFGLPGNPISTAVGYRFLLHPALRRLRGQPDETPRRLPLAAPAAKPAALRAFFKARVEAERGTIEEVRVLEGQQSFRVAPLLEANAWAVLPEGVDEVPAGASVDVHPLLAPLTPELRP